MPILYRTQTYTTTGTMQSWNLDHTAMPFNAALRVTLNTGAVNYRLQWTLTPLGPTDADTVGNWVDSTDIPANTTGSASSTFFTPVARIRVVIGTATAASLTVETLQSMSTN